MDTSSVITGVLKNDLGSLFDTKIESELREIQAEKDRLDNETKKYDDVAAILERLPHELAWSMPLLPLTRHALVPGATLKNTNEVQVHIGDGWFTRCSTHHARGICHRRQEKCRATKEALEKREKMLLEWLRVAQGKMGIDGGHEEQEGSMIEALRHNEINEFVTEEEYQAEKEAHKQRTREHYLQQRSLIKTQQEMPDSELWTRLDELELEESSRREVRDIGSSTTELGGATVQPSCKKEAQLENPSGHAVEREEGVVQLGWTWDDGFTESEESSENEREPSNEKKTDNQRPRKLSFAPHIESSNDDTCVIEFAHTPVEPATPRQVPGTINVPTSPSEVYASYQELFAEATQKPKSILKRTISSEKYASPAAVGAQFEFDPPYQSAEESEEEYHETHEVLGDVVENPLPTPTEPEPQVQPKKMSKFKAFRLGLSSQ